MVKMKDYEPLGEVEAATPYSAWKILGAENRAVQPGDVLEILNADGVPGDLLVVKYIGFEPAKWYVPEAKPDTGTQAKENSDSAVSDIQPHPL